MLQKYKTGGFGYLESSKDVCVKTSASVSQGIDLCTLTNGFLCLMVILGLDQNQTGEFSLPFLLGILRSVFLLMSHHCYVTCHTSTHAGCPVLIPDIGCGPKSIGLL